MEPQAQDKNNMTSNQTPPNCAVRALPWKSIQAAPALLAVPSLTSDDGNAAEAAPNAPPPMPDLDLGESFYKEGSVDGPLSMPDLDIGDALYKEGSADELLPMPELELGESVYKEGSADVPSPSQAKK